MTKDEHKLCNDERNDVCSANVALLPFRHLRLVTVCVFVIEHKSLASCVMLACAYLSLDQELSAFTEGGLGDSGS